MLLLLVLPFPDPLRVHLHVQLGSGALPLVKEEWKQAERGEETHPGPAM